MKTIACSAVGGPAECTYAATKATEDEMIQDWHDHFGQNHAEIVKDVSDEDKAKWKATHHTTWEATPES